PPLRVQGQTSCPWHPSIQSGQRLAGCPALALGRKDPDAAARQFQTAIDYLRTRTIEASPDGPWTEGADYNLARCYEATGQ
ncbi:MAG: tetratricopeptide repeat protein, partial [Planctomycetota bacterium]